MKDLLRPLLLLVPLMLSGCASKPALDVQRDFDAHYAFDKARHWDFTGGTLETDAARNTAEHLQLNSLVESAIRQQLATRGLTEGGTPPDLHISYSFGEWALDTHKKPNGGYGAVGMMFPGAHGSLLPNEADGRVPPPSKDPYTSKYEEAKLEILVIDAASKRIVFHGGVTDKSDFGYFRPEQHDRISGAVSAILADFPPRTSLTPPP